MKEFAAVIQVQRMADESADTQLHCFGGQRLLGQSAMMLATYLDVAWISLPCLCF